MIARLARRAGWGAALVAAAFALTGAPACGADRGEAACDEGGGAWYEDGCVGAEDICGRTACNQAFGPGCHCDVPGECWDPQAGRCRAE